MSIVSVMTAQNDCRLVIPYPGKMFKSNISKTDRALSFVINKGYIDARVLDSLLIILDDFDNKDLVKVGDIEKIVLKGNRGIIYRQRVFFKSLAQMLNICLRYGIKVELGQDFHVTINNVMNVLDDLKYLERYSAVFSETIDTWLTNCCIVHLNRLLLNKNMYSSINRRAERILKGRIGYLDRAPFLISSYNIDTHTSGLFLEFDTDDKRIYSFQIQDKMDIVYGYTDKNVEKDIRQGFFNEN